MTEDSFEAGERWGESYCPKTFLTFQDDTWRPLKNFSGQHPMNYLISPPTCCHASECSILHQKSVLCQCTPGLHRKLKGVAWFGHRSWRVPGLCRSWEVLPLTVIVETARLSFSSGTPHLGGLVAVAHSKILLCMKACYSEPRPYCKPLCHWSWLQQKMKLTRCSLKIKGEFYRRMGE